MRISEIDFLVDLIEFSLPYFDVILGMDWLGKHEAQLDCWQGKISLKGPNWRRVSYKGKINGPKVRLVSAMRLKKHLKRGASLILCHIKDTRVEYPDISHVDIVNEFVDVFPDEVPDMPPELDVWFEIDLALGSTPITKAPYRMAPAELQELKK